MYDLTLKEGEVCRIIKKHPGLLFLEVRLLESADSESRYSGERLEKAINYESLTGIPSPGDRVILNTTAVDLGLGTGGYHFVCANLSAKREKGLAGGNREKPGHIMKLRYTPCQLRTCCVEEEVSPYHHLFREFQTLGGFPVVIIPLHSLLAPLVISYRLRYPSKKIAYLMTEGGSLALELSNDLRELKKRGYLDKTITFGQSFGGDLETVNIFTALIAAHKVLKADLIVVGMGPGIVGTNTSLGFSGTEISLICHAVRLLEGKNILIPRVSFAEKRKRHTGISHHTNTLLQYLIHEPVDLVFPENDKLRILVEKALWRGKHKIYFFPPAEIEEVLRDSGFKFNSMGRGFDDDPLFFTTAGLAVYRLEEITNHIIDSHK